MSGLHARRSSVLIVTAALALICGSLGGIVPAQAQTGGFVQKQGRTLVLDGSQWVAKGWNDYRLTDTFTGYACNPGRGPLTDVQLATLFDQIRGSGATVVRTWFFQSYYQGQANHWAAFDRVLNAASVVGVKVIPVLVNHWQSCEASGVDKNHGFYQQAYQQPGFGYPLSFLEYAKTVTAHYKDSRTVAFWELANEPETSYTDATGFHCPNDAASVLRSFADTMTGAIKGVDPNHLVSLGTLGSGQCGAQGSQYADVHAGAVDICSYHDYDADTVPISDDGFNRLRQRLDQCRLLGKPIYLGEAGIVADVAPTGGSSCGPASNCITSATLSRRAAMFRAKVDAAFAEGAVGYLIWEKIPEASSSQVNNDNGRFGVGPGDPTDDVIRTCCGGAHSGFTPLPPSRILDTRDGTGGLAEPLGAGATVDVQVAGRGGVPASGATAVAVNVTVTQPTGDGFLTVYPAGTARPLAANLNFTPGKTVPNLVVAKLGADGKVSMFNSAGSTHVIYDVAGWYAGGTAGNDGRFTSLVPSRILDTRDGTGGGVRLQAGTSLDLVVSGRGGVPTAGAEAAVLNVAVTNTTAASYLTVFPTGGARPLAANLNFVGGDTVSNRVMAKLGAGGKVTIYNNAGSTDVVVDVGGWYTDPTVSGTTGAYTPLPPARILDTRDATGGVAGPVGGGTAVAVQVTGRGGVPSDGVSAVILNATVTQPAGPGHLTISPTGSAMPLASDLNYAVNETRPNLVVVRVGTGGKVNLYSSVGAQVIFDVAGWFS